MSHLKIRREFPYMPINVAQRIADIGGANPMLATRAYIRHCFGSRFDDLLSVWKFGSIQEISY